jgi:hypothetical protein
MLKECTMVKNFMISGARSKGKKPDGGSGGKGTTPFPGEEAVMLMFNGPIPMSPSVSSNLHAGKSTL